MLLSHKTFFYQHFSQRDAFGKPLLDNQYIHFRLAELNTELELVGAKDADVVVVDT